MIKLFFVLSGTLRGPPGFRLLRDMKLDIFRLEVSSKHKVWNVTLTDIPRRWIYFSFTWEPTDGLKVYFNGYLAFVATEGIVVSKAKRAVKKAKIYIGKEHSITGVNYGKFQIGHFAMWDKALTPKQVRKAYKAVVIVTPKEQICCQTLKGNSFFSNV